jgi:MoaA/NifB/PqqE/SkfB family radical SAM enzyme
MAILSTGHKIRLDLGNYCNLDCPSCFRQAITKDYNKKNNTSYEYHPYLNNRYVTVDDVKTWFPVSFLNKHVQNMLFDGASSEPTLNPHFEEILSYFCDNVPEVTMSTNGSTRNVKWWEKIGKTKLYPTFSIDSLKPNNNLYRIGSDTNKIIENMKAFISAGGKARLKMILFKHNQDEIEDFISFSNEIGCDFDLIPAFEFVNKTSYEVNYKGKTYLIEKNNLKERNKPYRELSSDPNDYCILKTSKTIIVHSNGVIYPCCHIEGQFFQIYEDFFIDEANTKPNLDVHPQIAKDFVSKIEIQGGIKSLSLKYNSIENIFNSSFFKSALETSWKLKSNKTCMECKNWQPSVLTMEN